RAGERPRADEYEARFPGAAALIEALGREATAPARRTLPEPDLATRTPPGAARLPASWRTRLSTRDLAAATAPTERAGSAATSGTAAPRQRQPPTSSRRTPGRSRDRRRQAQAHRLAAPRTTERRPEGVIRHGQR